MTQHDDLETMRRAYEAFNHGDMPGALAAFDDQIEWHEPGGGKAPAGTFHGTESVTTDVFATIPANFTEFRADPERFIADAAGYLAVVGTFHGQGSGGQQLDAPFVHVWEMRNGKAVRFHNHVEAADWRQGWGG
jgi:ketosteroid isomerase-like protein